MSIENDPSRIPNSPEGYTPASPEALANLSTQANQLWVDSLEFSGKKVGDFTVSSDEFCASFEIEHNTRAGGTLASANRSKLSIYRDLDGHTVLAVEEYRPTLEVDGQFSTVTCVGRMYPLAPAQPIRLTTEVGRLTREGRLEELSAPEERILDPVSASICDTLTENLTQLREAMDTNHNVPVQRGIGVHIGRLFRRHRTS